MSQRELAKEGAVYFQTFTDQPNELCLSNPLRKQRRFSLE
jgi:hypothetical protein